MTIGEKLASLITESGLAIYGGRIASPGKFEGERSEVLYFYDRVLDGDSIPMTTGDDDLVLVDTLELDDEERAYFRQPVGVVYQIITTDNGFIKGRFFNKLEA